MNLNDFSKVYFSRAERSMTGSDFQPPAAPPHPLESRVPPPPPGCVPNGAYPAIIFKPISCQNVRKLSEILQRSLFDKYLIKKYSKMKERTQIIARNNSSTKVIIMALIVLFMWKVYTLYIMPIIKLYNTGVHPVYSDSALNVLISISPYLCISKH